ncbi:FAD binding domain-containing protein [Kribbella solani]|uniref:FAD binding domain-containing protein n=1 Tax=Kribbella solani TaxID=236067 RepID=UPI0029B92F15|nr:FAD binding domain-containing protein [Kribbella solani]MDX3003430.1 FAD binding domain-containing protein [Kribbella solani]
MMISPGSTVELAALPGAGSLLAGGTDVLVQRRDGRDFGTLVDVTNLADAPAVVERRDGLLILSALAPIAELDRQLGESLPGLRMAIGCFASQQIRNRATLGGNLANASPAADCVPPLVAAEAVLVLRSAAGTRRVPVDDFAQGPRRTCLQAGEWVHAVEVPDLNDRVEGFRKLAGRRALAISVASLAWSWRETPDGLKEVRLAAGAVAPTVIRCKQTEALLNTKQPTATANQPTTGPTGVAAPAAVTAAAVTAALQADISPIDDLRASAAYRRAALAGVLVEALGAHLLEVL